MQNNRILRIVAVVAGVLAVAAIAVAVIVLVGHPAADGPGTAPSASPSDDSKRAAADRINLCGAPVASVAPAASGLLMAVHFPATATVKSAPVVGTVTMTNTGKAHLKGTTAASPAITLSQAGVTVWHSNGPMIMLAALVDLEPGASMTYQAAFTPVRCSAADDAAPSFPDSLPQASPGNYQVSAAIDFSPDVATGSSGELVTSPLSAITLN